MDTIRSADFRKTYAKLATTTLVTVNGHVIGTWTPFRSDGRLARAEAEALAMGVPLTSAERTHISPGFNSRPFTPVPKSGK